MIVYEVNGIITCGSIDVNCPSRDKGIHILDDVYRLSAFGTVYVDGEFRA